MAKQNSFYTQTENIKKWLNSDGANLLKQIKEWYPKETYNKVYKLFSDVNGATSTDKIKKFNEFEAELNNVIFNDAEKKYKNYQEWRKKNPDTPLTNENDKRLKNMETALNFKRGMPTKERNYEGVSIDGDTDKYKYDDMKYLAGQYGFDYDNKKDRSEFLEALSKYQRQKNIDEIMDESTLVNFALPVAKEYAKQNIDKLSGDFSDKILDVPGTVINNPKLGAAVAADAATNVIMLGKNKAYEEPLKEALRYGYNYGAAPVLREGANVVAGNKDLGQGAIDATAGILTNVVTPRIANMPFRGLARAWNFAEGVTNRTKQQAVNEAADKVSEVKRRIKNGAVIRTDIKNIDGNDNFVVMHPDILTNNVDDPYNKRFYIYVTKDGKAKRITSDQVKKLKRGEKVEELPENINIEDIIQEAEFDAANKNFPLWRGDRIRDLFKSKTKDRLKKVKPKYTGEVEKKGKEISEYTPIEYAAIFGKPETRFNQASRIIDNFSKKRPELKNYYINAIGRPDYGGQGVTSLYNSFVGPLTNDKMKYEYGGNKKDAKKNVNALALYLANFKRYAENPDIVDKPERPEGFTKESLESLENDIVSRVFRK